MAALLLVILVAKWLMLMSAGSLGFGCILVGVYFLLTELRHLNIELRCLLFCDLVICT